MAEAVLLGLAVVCSFCGMVWFALAKQPHWQQARGPQSLAPRAAHTLHVLGSVALVASLILCLRVEHVSMAPLVWVMTLPASALAVAFILAWRPRLLRWLVAWLT